MASTWGGSPPDDADGLRLRSRRLVLDHERCACDDAVALVDDSSAGLFSDGGAICLPSYEPYEPPGPCEAPEETSREVRFDLETGWPPAE